MDVSMYHYDAVDSTNTQCRRLAAEGVVNAVVTADCQTAGRGEGCRSAGRDGGVTKRSRETRDAGGNYRSGWAAPVRPHRRRERHRGRCLRRGRPAGISSRSSGQPRPSSPVTGKE